MVCPISESRLLKLTTTIISYKVEILLLTSTVVGSPSAAFNVDICTYEFSNRNVKIMTDFF